jgi:hypothetical protein
MDHEETEEMAPVMPEPEPAVEPEPMPEPPKREPVAICQRAFDVPINGTPTSFVAGQAVSEPAALAAFRQFKAPVHWQED